MIAWLKSITWVQWLRLAIVLVLIGIITQFIAFLQLTPPTFFLYALIGIPCMLLGMLIYAVHVFQLLRKKDAL